MSGKTAGGRGLRHAGAVLAVAAAVAALATACSEQTYTTISYPVGPAGSATYRHALAFAHCMRSHGAPNLPVPAPGGSFGVRVPQEGAGGKPDPAAQAVDACRHLLPQGGSERTNTRITIG